MNFRKFGKKFIAALLIVSQIAPGLIAALRASRSDPNR